MKQKLFILVAAVVLLASCQDNSAVREARGGYSYKTSGTVFVGTERVALSPESGQMEIVPLHDDTEVLLTMNAMGSDSYTTTATIDRDGHITLKPFRRAIEIRFDTTRLLTWPERELFDITVEGSGTCYDDVVVLELNYDGRSNESGHLLSNDHVTMIGKRN